MIKNTLKSNLTTLIKTVYKFSVRDFLRVDKNHLRDHLMGCYRPHYEMKEKEAIRISLVVQGAQIDGFELQ